MSVTQPTRFRRFKRKRPSRSRSGSPSAGFTEALSVDELQRVFDWLTQRDVALLCGVSSRWQYASLAHSHCEILSLRDSHVTRRHKLLHTFPAVFGSTRLSKITHLTLRIPTERSYYNTNKFISSITDTAPRLTHLTVTGCGELSCAVLSGFVGGCKLKVLQAGSLVDGKVKTTMEHLGANVLCRLQDTELARTIEVLDIAGWGVIGGSMEAFCSGTPRLRALCVEGCKQLREFAFLKNTVLLTLDVSGLLLSHALWSDLLRNLPSSVTTLIAARCKAPKKIDQIRSLVPQLQVLCVPYCVDAEGSRVESLRKHAGRSEGLNVVLCPSETDRIFSELFAYEVCVKAVEGGSAGGGGAGSINPPEAIGRENTPATKRRRLRAAEGCFAECS